MTAATETPAAPPHAGRVLPTILLAGLAGGAVDFVYASTKGVLTGQGFARVWQGVASGWMSRETAIQGGATTAGLGLVTHFGIATAMAGTYVLAARRIPAVRERPWASSIAYGVGLYGVMYHLVLPLRWPTLFPRWKSPDSALDVAAHIGVAAAITWVVLRAARPPLGKH